MVSSSMSSVKLVLVSTGVLSAAVAVVAAAPAVAHFCLVQAPAIWSSLAAWLRPPYLYLVINFIIITIAASSRFYSAGDSHPPPHPEEEEHHHRPRPQPAEEEEEDVVGVGMLLPVRPAPEAEVYGNIGGGGVGPVPAVAEGEMVTWRPETWVAPPPVASSPERIDSGERELLDAAVSYSPPLAGEDNNKPLVSLSARFGHRKPTRSSPEGARALRVSRPKRHETLENTWKTITEGRSMPLTRHLKKAETFSENQNHNNGRQVNVGEGVNQAAVVRKSETFRDRTNQQLPPVAAAAAGSSPKLRKEPSLSQDELNRRVEAFIRKFNEEMRLQRQESLNQYKEMISGGGLS